MKSPRFPAASAPDPGPKSVRRRPGARRIALLAGGAVLLGLVVWFFLPGDPYALPGSDWRAFKQRFLAEDGRIVDDGNGGISHTEGQGYGMLLAVAYRDRAAFDRMWNWTKENLKRKDDALFSWKWTPEDGGKVADPNNATDGDLLLAWALQRAFREWSDYRYQSAAAQIVISIFDRTTVDTYLGLQLLPGVDGFRKPGGVVLNPSYYIFPALEELRSAFPSDKWAALTAGGDNLLATARFGKWGLTPDWALVASRWVDLGPGHEPFFGYNAIRVPLHLAWENPDAPLLRPFAAFWEGLPAEGPVPDLVNLKTDAFGPYAALPGMMAVRQLVLACAKKTTITVTDVPRIEKDERYYSASLKLLVKLAIRERFAPKRN